MGARVDEMIMHGKPLTLSDRELELDIQPLTRTPVAIPATAWIRYGAVAVKLDVEIVAWTPKSVAVRWKTPTGDVHKAWIWASAVTTENRNDRSQ